MRGYVLLATALILCSNNTVGQNNVEIEKIEHKLDSIVERKQYVEQQLANLKIEREALSKIQDDLIKSKNDLMIKTGTEDLYVCEMDTYIYDSPNRKTQLKKIKEETIIKVLETRDKSFRVISDGTEGWVSIYLVKSFEKIRIEKERVRLDSIADAKTKTDNKIELIKKYGNRNAERIINKEIWIGMPDDMLIDSWGKPKEINRTVNEYGTSEQWVYGEKNYVYVDNGIVKGWQD